jgi:hypothetical protein
VGRKRDGYQNSLFGEKRSRAKNPSLSTGGYDLQIKGRASGIETRPPSACCRRAADHRMEDIDVPAIPERV